ncbi:MAG: hypothetical protein IKT31_03675, partial [Firmicutes bacterium]|nr:hypothetical protein [Bacillota bacterium]
MKKRMEAAVALIMMMMFFTGCMRCENTMVLNEDGSGHVVSSVWIDKETADAVGAEMGMTAEEMGVSEARIEEEDGRTYYVAEDRVEFADCEELKAFLKNSGYKDIYVSPDLIHFTFYSDLTEADVESMKEWMDESAVMARIAVSMPEEIVFTNGQLSEDKKSAVFSFGSDELVTSQEIIVSTVPAEEETEGPVISGAKNKKTYNSARTIAVKDAVGVQKAQYKFREPSAEKYGKYKKLSGEKVFTENGTYYIRAYDNYGNKSVLTFTIKDTKKPQIHMEGKMNKKQTYY